MNKKGRGIILFILCVGVFAIAVLTLYPDSQSIINHSSTNRTLLPEDILTNNLTIICVSGYSATVRDVSDSLKNEVYSRDNIIKSNLTAIDHIVPLCLGGSNVIHNLRAMYISEKVKKDNLERYLCNDKVCTGEINIDYAQQKMASDWYSYYQEIYP